jgi:hypothetical protein
MTDEWPTEVDALVDGTRAQWAKAFASGHPVDPGQLAGSAYLGISLGLPGWVDRLAWKTFVKAFATDPDAPDRTMGWNVRMVQAGLDGPHEPMRNRAGQPKTFGFFQVLPMPEAKVNGLGDGHTLLHYGVSRNPVLDPSRAVRDPVVSLRADSSDLLLGRTYLSVAGGWVPTPSWFLLVRRAELEGLASG